MNRPDRAIRARDEHISPLRLSTYADDETPREERAEIEAHLAACPVCSGRLDALRSVSAALAALPRTTPSAGVFDSVLAGARRVDNASNAVARERLGRARGNGPRLREVRLPDMDTPSATTPARRRSPWRAPFTAALPTIAALLLITLTAGLLMRSSLVTTMLPNTEPTATIPPGDTLNATARAVHNAASQLPFKPEAPTYLPAGARLDAVALTTLAPGKPSLDLTWKMSAGPLRALRLRQQPASAPTSGYVSPATQTVGLAWRLGQQRPTWRAMTQVEQPGWIGVEQVNGPVLLLLDAQPAPGAASSDVVAELRLTSLSLDAPFTLPPVAISGPLAGSLQRSIASVAGTDGRTWTWYVTLSADTLSRRETIVSTSGAGAEENVTEITYAGVGVRLDQIHHSYQTIPGPTPYNVTPSGVTEIAYTANAYLSSGELWNLGPTTITPPGGRPIKVYDLYRVDTAQPEHVYADAATGAVVAIFVDISIQGVPGGAQPYVSATVCAPYTVTYAWIIFEPATQSASLFNTTPPSGWTQGAVPLPFICGG